ncbi:hypothetical protein D3C74_379400 [compost metagenome]
MSGCLTEAVTPRRSQITPEMTRPEMSEIWNVATPRTPTVTPSDRTMTAPHRPARKFHHGIVRPLMRRGIASASRRVTGRANTMTNIRTRPVPNEMRAAAWPSPIVLPS